MKILFQWSRYLNASIRTVLLKMKVLAFSCLFGALWCLHFGLFSSLIITFFAYLFTGGWKFIIIIAKTLPRDVRGLIVVTKLKRTMKKYTQDQVGVPTLFYQVCDRNPEKTCFIDVIGDRYWSFNDVDKYSNKIANYFLSLGYQPGDCVAILMESGGQYVATWLGLAKIGVVPALLNYNLRLDSLAHCLHAAEAKSLIYSSVFRGAIEEAQSLLPPSLSQFELGDSVKTYVDDNIEKTSAVRPPLLRYNFNSPLIYIYTSGTTGLPKAAKVVHSRYFYMANTLYNFGGMNSTTIIYDTLPIYHSAGGILGVGQALLQGEY